MSDNPTIGKITFGPSMDSPADPADALRRVDFSAEMRAINRDAKRYRWLREQIKNKHAMVRAQSLFWTYSSRREFDKAVDDLMELVTVPVTPDRL